MAKVIEGKVAKILDDQKLVINVGHAHGVTQGMIFCIFAPVEEVKDPDSGESLGNWEVVKGYVQATHPQDKLTVCQAFVPKRPELANPEDRGTHTLSSELVAVSMLEASARSLVRLNINAAQASGTPEVGPISVGDGVRSVDEAELTGQ